MGKASQRGQPVQRPRAWQDLGWSGNSKHVGAAAPSTSLCGSKLTWTVVRPVRTGRDGRSIGRAPSTWGAGHGGQTALVSTASPGRRECSRRRGYMKAVPLGAAQNQV